MSSVSPRSTRSRSSRASPSSTASPQGSPSSGSTGDPAFIQLGGGLSVQVRQAHRPFSRESAVAGDGRQFLVSVSAPDLPAGAIAPARTSLNLSLVLDVSGSMSGPPLVQACQSLGALVSAMDPSDRVSLVTYGDQARVVLESCPVSQAREVLPGLIAQIRADGCTALHAGWLAGAAQVAPFVGQYAISRVILLSDGCANVGKFDPVELAADAVALRSEGISVSTYGIGAGFNEDLMSSLAQAGGGNGFYAESADALAGHFVDEMGMLSRAVARDLEVTADFVQRDGDVEIRMPLVPETLSRADGSEVFHAPLVLPGAESWTVFTATPAPIAASRAVFLNLKIVWVDAQSGARSERVVSTPVDLSDQDGVADPVVSARLAEIRAAALARDVARNAAVGNLSAAQGALAQMASLSGASAYVRGVHESLSNAVSMGDLSGATKEAHYASVMMCSRVADLDEDVQSSSSGRYGQRKSRQGRSVRDPQQGKDGAA